MQETCVTVTLMKFVYQLHVLTGDPKYTDAFETSLYNAYLGSVNTEKVIEPTLSKEHPDWKLEPLPFDSYSPLTAGTRGTKIGGLKAMSDDHYYGCCACIGAAGIGLVSKIHTLTARDGLVLNLYIDGDVQTRLPSGTGVRIKTETDYPKGADVKITVIPEKKESFKLYLRIPEWSRTTELKLGGKAQKVTAGYTVIEREFEESDTVILTLDMRTQAILPIPYGTDILMNEVIWGANYMVST